jgi:hypothetical protein
MFKKLVIVTRKTRLQELIERFNTRSQAKFYIEHAGGNFIDYEQEDDSYRRALSVLQTDLNFGLPQQLLDRTLIPTFEFRDEDVVVTLLSRSSRSIQRRLGSMEFCSPFKLVTQRRLLRK